jgi:hypothetical protein
VTNWLDTDPATWNVIAAGYEQMCPDDCGTRIGIGAPITNVSGVWRRRNCAVQQWTNYHGLVNSGTQTELLAAIKRVTRQGEGYVVVRAWDPTDPRYSRYRWSEVVPEREERK